MNTIGTAILVLRTDKSGFTGGLDSALKDVRVFKGGVLDVSKALPALGTALAGAFSAAAVLAAGKQVIDFAGEITDLSKRLSISTTTAQEWKATFGAAGVELGTVAKASEELSKRLMDGDEKAIDVLTKMGMRVDDLRAMKPEDRLIAVSDAVGRIADADEKLYASKALFGKGGAEMLSALDGNLGTTIDRMRDLGMVIDEETIAAADDFGDQLGFMGQQLLGIVATVIGPLLPALSALGNVLMWIGRNVVGPVLNVAIKSAMTLLAGFWEVLTGVLAEAAKLASKLPLVGDKFAGMAAILEQTSKSSGQYMQDLWKKTEETGAAADTAAPKLLGLGKASEDAGKKHKQQADELAKLGEKIADINRSTQAGLWAPKAADLSAPLDDYIQSLKDAAEQIDKVRAIERGASGGGIWNIGVQLDTKDAQAAVEALTEEARTSLGGMLGTIVQGLPGLLQQAFTGGGGVGGFAQALTSQIGEALGSKLFAAGGPMNGIGNKLAGLFGDSFGLALPGIGSALGALVGPIMGKLFSVLKNIGGPSQQELQGRDLTKQFQDSLGGFEQMMLTLGDDAALIGRPRAEIERLVKSMLDAEKQGPAAVKPWMDALQDIHDQAERAREETERATTEAIAAADAASQKRMQVAEQEIADLLGKRNELAKGIAAEAAEEDMGVIERSQRAELAGLDAQLQQKADAYAQLAEETGQAMADAIVEALRTIRIEPITVPYVVSGVGGASSPPVVPMAAGGFGRVTAPTLFYSAGQEDFAFSGEGRRFSDSGSGMDVSALAAELAGLRREMPQQVGLAVVHAMAKYGVA